jgi:hypothetical protein
LATLESDPGAAINVQGIVIEGQRWELNVDSFYFDVITLLRRLMANTKQMQAAENRFSQSVGNWYVR